jgi:hypothetical protein
MKKIVVAAVGAVLAAGCAISQKVEPARLSSKSICVLENTKVREGFRDALVSSLQEKGYAVRLVGADATPDQCPSRVMYNANWTWDLALYMRRAELIVFENDQIVGRALYDATAGGARMDKFIEAETKVRELVAELFPA